MTPVLQTISYFAHRAQVTKVIVLGDFVGLSSMLSPWVRFEAIGPRTSQSLSTADLSNTLIAVINADGPWPQPGLANILNKASETARLILSFDPQCVLQARSTGWRQGRDLSHSKLFGADLGFSLFDPRLPTAVPAAPDIRIRPILAVFNEVDIIEASVDAMLASHCEPIVIDNWSTDGTYEVLKSYADAGRIVLERFPFAGASNEYDWRTLLARKEQIALEYPNDWLLHQDADEVRKGAFPDLSFKQNFWLANYYGANAIDFCVLNFRPINNNWAQGQDLSKIFSHFEMGESSSDYTRQVKAWHANGEAVSLAEQAGHEVRFRGRSILPYKFLLQHYPLRSDSHARQKLHKDRIPRFSQAERALGWHTHYDAMAEEASYLWDADALYSLKELPSGFGSSLMTGLPPDAGHTKEQAAPGTARVWLPYEAWLVVDLPIDPVAAFGPRLALAETLSLLLGSFETVRVLATNDESVDFASARGVSVEKLALAAFTDSDASPSAYAISVAARLRQIAPAFVFGLENGGALSKAVALKSQGLDFEKTLFAVVLAGGTQRRLRAGGLDLYTPLHFECDHLEMLAATRADLCLTADPGVSREWTERGVDPARITQALTPSAQIFGPRTSERRRRIDQVLVFAPQTGVDWEDLAQSLGSINAAAPGIPIVVAGPAGSLFGEHAGGYLVRAAARQDVVLDLIGNVPLDTILDAFIKTSTLVVLPRCGGAETYALNAFAGAGHSVAVIGTAGTILPPQLGSVFVAAEERGALGRLVARILCEEGDESVLRSARPLPPGDLTDWANWSSGLVGRHMTMPRPSAFDPADPALPLVSIIIPHFDRVALLIECVTGFLKQTYKRIEIIVVDDGSRLPENRDGLLALERMLSTSSGRIVWQKNSYLGAARNAGAAAASGGFYLFFDDDDVPVPTMVEVMVRAALARDADVVSGELFFWSSGRSDDAFDEMKVSSAFVGACPELAYWRNPFGSAAVLVKGASFDEIGHYTTDYGVGWEDYEFAARTCLKGFVYENIPLALYLYRVDYHGMAATTPTLANGRRVWRSLSAFADHPAMQAVLRAGFMQRIWHEERESKWSWLHTLGERTANYHRLMLEPYNSRESNELIIKIADQEGHEIMARRLERTLLEQKWTPLRLVRTTSASEARGDSADDVLKVALSLSEIGLVKDAIALLTPLAAAQVWEARLALARLHLVDERPDEAANIAASLVRERPNEPEAMMALYAAAEDLSDAHVLQVAQRALFDRVARRLLEHYPEIDSFGGNTDLILMYWVDKLLSKGIPLVEFKYFPDGVSPLVIERFGGWIQVDPNSVAFTVPGVDHGFVLPNADGVFLHPPAHGEISKAVFRLPQTMLVSELSALATVVDVRAHPVEVAIIPLSDEPDSEKLARVNKIPNLSHNELFGAPFEWTTITARRTGNLVLVKCTLPVSCRFVLLMTRMKSDAENSHASTHIQDIRIRSIGSIR